MDVNHVRMEGQILEALQSVGFRLQPGVVMAACGAGSLASPRVNSRIGGDPRRVDPDPQRVRKMPKVIMLVPGVGLEPTLP